MKTLHSPAQLVSLVRLVQYLSEVILGNVQFRHFWTRAEKVAIPRTPSNNTIVRLPARRVLDG